MPRLNSLNKRTFTRPSLGLDVYATPSATAVNEGQTFTCSVVTKGAANGTSLYWTYTGTATAADITGSPTSGSFTITNNTGSFSVTFSADQLFEGPENIIFQIRTGSSSGRILAILPLVNIADTSVSYPAEYLIVAGGGGSGANGGGGGGAGGLLSGSTTLAPGSTYTFTVGAGGGYFSQGSNTVAFGLTAIGGGRGANRDGPGAEATVGGSGGGGSTPSGPGTQETGRAGTPGQGNAGGSSTRGQFVSSGGGGGGATSAGGNYNGTTGGTGGNGFLSNISGEPQGYAGGGGGSGIDYGGYNGVTGLVHYENGIWYGGGGWQVRWTLGERDGRPNSGGGGGGLGDGNDNPAGQGDSGGGSGGSGIVIVRYANTIPASSFTSNVVYRERDGFRIYMFSTSGSFTVGSSTTSYSIDSNVATAREGNTIAWTVNTIGVADNTTLYWTTTGTVGNADLVQGNVGSVVVTNNTASFTTTLTSDGSAEGLETMSVQLRTGSISGTVVTTSIPVLVRD